MSKAASLPYHLRPNKAVDRELFLSLLVRLDPLLSFKRHRYYGLGGPFLSDLRVIHSRLGIDKMTCIEADEEVHKRQRFNSPVDSIDYVHDTLDNYFDRTYLDEPAIVWLDYTEPKAVASQIARFADTVCKVPLCSVVRLTLNANPSALGVPPPEELSVEVDGDVSEGRTGKPTIQEWRLKALKGRLGVLFPNDLTPSGMETREFGRSLLQAVKIAVDRAKLHCRDREIVWAFATHYADGQAMITATVVVAPVGGRQIADVIERWEYYTSMDKPHCLDLPVLSTLERITMESKPNAKSLMDFDLPEGSLKDDAFAVFKQFYRVYPHFSRVEW